MDNTIVEKALRYAQLCFKLQCLKKRHMQMTMLQEETQEIENIPKELKMAPEKILEIAEQGRTEKRTC